MFNIDDEKRPVPRASLLDFAAEDARDPARARDRRTADPQGAGSSLLGRPSGSGGSANQSAARRENRSKGQPPARRNGAADSQGTRRP
ncbi:hypothetical protein [Ensifer adhaerens]